MAAGGEGEPNLTPFIDLFAVLISFLLMTAAFLQLEALQVGISNTSDKSTAQDNPNPTPTPDESKKVKLSVLITAKETVFSEDETKTAFSHLSDRLDKTAVEQFLGALKIKYPDRKDMKVETEAGVFYGQLIQIYDLLIAAEFPEVGISTN